MLLVLPELDSLSLSKDEIWVTKLADAFGGHDWAEERFKNTKYGRTQMPECWLSVQEKKTRAEIFDLVVAFTVVTWESGMKRKSYKRSALQDGFFIDLCLLESMPSTKPKSLVLPIRP